MRPRFENMSAEEREDYNSSVEDFDLIEGSRDNRLEDY